MAYRKKTLRSMSPVTRELARLIGEIDSVSRRAKNLLEKIQSLEHDSRALQNHSCQETVQQATKEVF